ncbi:MAG: iron ABC transporter permease [Opitutales bacterium]|nr:iron ABC transporter permease [Opitutales bacterium]
MTRENWKSVRQNPPWYFLLPAVLAALVLALCILYLALRAVEGGWGELWETLWRRRNLVLLGNTLRLALGVIVFTTLIAFPLAWLSVRTELSRWKFLSLLGVLPLAIPGYIMAWAILSLGGDYGIVYRLTGQTVPRISGYWGALLAISLYAFPYLYLNLRSALLGLDPSHEDAARSLGRGPVRIFLEIILPQCRPAFLAGALIVVLYVLGDFGSVTLMRYETISHAVFVQYNSLLDRQTASGLALVLVVLAALLLWLEIRLLGRIRWYRVGTGTARGIRLAKLTPLAWGVVAVFLLLVYGAALLTPLGVICFWLIEYPPVGEMPRVWRALGDSLSVAVPAAFLAGAAALPVAYIGVRYPSGISRGLERISYFGYAMPPLALALAAAAISLQLFPFLFQTLGLLIVICALHFLAEGMGPIRTALYQASPRLEEAARSLGCNPLMAFFRSTFPLLVRGLLAGIAFVFLSVMKELPITYILSPWGFSPLAVNIWDLANEGMYAEAAPHALALLLISLFFVGFLMLREKRLS